MPIAQIDTCVEPTQVIVAVSGEIDISVREAFAAALAAAVERARARQVVVDLSRTSFMDATGIHALVGGMRAATAAGAGFTVTGVAGIVRLVLQTVGLLETLTTPGAGSPYPAAR